MHKLIAELEELTLKLVEHLDIATKEEIIQFVYQRGILIKGIQALAEKSRMENNNRVKLESILSYDPLIKAKMNSYKNLAAYELNKVVMGRMQKRKYETSYQIDGVFFDKKK